MCSVLMDPFVMCVCRLLCAPLAELLTFLLASVKMLIIISVHLCVRPGVCVCVCECVCVCLYFR